MKSQTNLTLAKLRKFILVTALVICPFLALQNGNAQVATATLTSGGLNSISITSNQTFTLSLGATTNFTSIGYSVFYSISANGINFFGIPNYVAGPPIFTPRTNTNAFFTDPTTADAVAFAGPGGFARFTFGPTGNSNQFDLGYTDNTVNHQPPGTFSLQNLQITALNAPAGTYTIRLDPRSILSTTNFTDVPIGGPNGPVFTINVVPEPATVGLAVLGGTLLLVVAWRRQRAQA